MKNKFKIIDISSGEKLKLGEGQMIVMNSGGVFFLVGGMDDYYMGIQRLSDVCLRYDVVWKGEE